MIRLKEIKVEDGYSVIVDEINFKYKTTDESRGANSKMWITNAENPNNTFETYHSYLFKTSFRREINKDVSARNFGEVFAAKVARALNLPYVNYLFCCFEDIQGQNFYGTVCATFKNSINDVEITGRDLHQLYMNRTGDTSGEINCVYQYLKELESIYGDRISALQIENIRQSMLKMALFDFVTCQTDRHWKNMGFLIPNGTDFDKFQLIPLYDNEKCFVFNKPLSWIEKFTIDMQKSKGNPEKMVSPIIDSLDRVPRLGIRTSTIKVSDSDVLLPKRPQEGEEDYTSVFTKELVEELHDNKELRDFYLTVKGLNMEETLQDEDAPIFLQQFASEIWNARIARLDKAYVEMFGPMEDKTEEVANVEGE